MADRGEDPALVARCEQLLPRLVGSLSLQTGDRAVAEELAQEALVRLWQQWPRVQALDSPEGWTYRVAMNLASSWWRRVQAERRAKRRLAREREPVAEPPPAAAAGWLRQALARLPPRQRQALVCRYYLDLSVGETAEVMGCAPGTVRALTAQGTAALRHARQATLESQEADHG